MVVPEEITSEANKRDTLRLQHMLTYCRPHGSKGEEEFVDRFIMPYKPTLYKDRAGVVLAMVVKVDDTPVLWSSHVDTVHPSTAPVRQKILFDEECGLIYKDDGMPLGADDGAGVWLMLEMLDAKVPGTYIFHRGEERGGIGSRGMAMEYKPFLEKFRWAIAFDRRGTGDIITTQFGGRTASDTFAQELAHMLGMGHEPCPHGVFTDTANYADIIFECTNVSVGYESEHTQHETLDVWYLYELRDAVIKAFDELVDLPVCRDPFISYGWEEGTVSGDAQAIMDMYPEELLEFIETSPKEDLADLLISLSEQVLISDKH